MRYIPSWSFHVITRDELKPSDVFIPTEDVNKTTNVEPECLADEANDNDHTNGKEEVMEVHDSPVIDSCLLLLKIIMMLKHRPSWL